MKIAPGKDIGHGQRSSLALDLERNESAPAIARAAIAGLCAQVGLSGVCRQTLLLLVSEVVTNALLHSNASPATPIRFQADADHDRVRVKVHDGGTDFIPAQARPGRGGWGLHLLDREARCWGVQQNDGTLVWFELALDAGPPAGVEAFH